ncbi:hypothetical protein J7K25_00825 [bacterium]|nr:hypothetical protein [bacterium]
MKRSWNEFVKYLNSLDWTVKEEEDFLIFSHKRYGEVIFNTNVRQEDILQQLPSDFDLALKFVLGIEKEKAYDKYGENTTFGITERWFPKEYKEITSLKSVEEKVKYAKRFYKEKFWYRFNCDLMQFPLNIIVFDTAVNMGPDDAIVIQKRKSKIPYEKSFLDAVNFLALRMIRYVEKVNKDKRKKKYLLGWLNRCKKLFEEFIEKEGKDEKEK